ncbi:cation:dicarboxylate symporter family transporter [Reichenbachiella sp.]|uniref:cation:dicarboxylate symporter family transporter n=1 Tax=Reichenbachiella sp. TaxID=2184521 RepID=UPI003BB1E362
MNKSLSRNIFIGLFAGIFIGLFLGEYAEPLGFIGDAFIGLMQMTVMPYIMVSILSNLGKINLSKQKKLIYSATIILVCFMGVGLVFLVVLPMFFPTWQSSSFFSSSLVIPPQAIDFIDIYIPSNLFGAMSNNVVPAVVLFSIIVGIALNSIPDNKRLIHAFDVIADALNKANKYIVKLTPYGLFGIAAHTTATLSLDELGLIQVYMVIYTMAVILIGLLFLPMIVSAITPFKYKDILGIPKSSLITIFATGKIVILLPQLIENIKSLFEKYGHKDEEVDSSAELVMPLAYPFPNLGTLVIMVFIPFAAWFAGQEFSMNDQAVFLASVFMSSFVAPIAGIPFLLDVLHLPHDVFQLFIVSTAYTDRIRVVLGAIHLFTLSVIAIAYAKGLIIISWSKILRAIALTGIATVVALLPFKLLIGDSFQASFDKYNSFVQMELKSNRAPERHSKKLTPRIPESILEIEKSGIMNIGYMSDALPYVFRNNDGEFVGYDVELMHILAKELNVTINWIYVPRDSIVSYVNSGYVDLFLSGIPVLGDVMEHVEYTQPYAEINLALLVKDHDRNRFKTKADILAEPDAVFATNQSSYLRVRIQEELPTVKFNNISSARQFLTDQTKADAMFFSAEAGSAWTLVYPEYSVVRPKDLHIRLPVAMMLARNNTNLERYLNNWIELKSYDGTLQRLYSNWILGEGTKVKEKKWSIIRNVLHWVD